MHYNQKTSRARDGFTLIELSAVILILSLLLAGILSIQNQKIRTERIAETNMKLKAISEALRNYRLLNNKLPCPGDASLAITNANFGLQANGTTCDAGGSIVSNNNNKASNAEVFGGSLPVTTLGLPADYAVDGWGSYFTYYVHSGASAAFSSGTSAVGVSTNAIVINGESSTIANTDVFAVVLSHGINGHGAFLPSGSRKDADSTNDEELNNCICNSNGVQNLSILVADTVTITKQRYKQADATDASDVFDDIVVYMPRELFIAPSEISN